MIRFFLPQAVLEQWCADEQVALNGNQLSFLTSALVLDLKPAVHFANVVSGGDEHQLMSKVKSLDQLQALGAEQMMTSVVLGEDAYEVVPGYLVEPPLSAASPGASASDAELLASFILDKLT